MPANDIIKQSDYNNIRNKLVPIIGAGSADSGWGQPIISSAVATGNRVTITEWNNLRHDIVNAVRHIFGSSLPAIPAVVAEGNTIRYNVPADTPNPGYDTLATFVVNNKFAVNSSQAATFSWTPSTSTWPGIYGSSWNTKIQATVSASWPSATAARYFFNSGGEIRFASSRSGGSSTQQCLAWTTLLNSAGTQAFGGNKPATGTAPANGQNWYRLTNSYQLWYSVASSTPYGGNSYRILARTPAVANNSTGTASTVEFLIEYVDNYVDPGTFPVGPNPAPPAANFPPGDLVDGTFTLSVSHLYATGVLDPSGTGNFTVTQPTIAVGAIAPG
jgi:hypothetical protein